MSTPPEAVGGRLKRAVDVAVALPLLIALAPVLLAIAVWIRRDSPGSAMFRQERVGLGGQTFRVWKFRTMVVGAQQMGTGVRVTSGDARITRAGRFLRATSLDELPQLVNVVLGDMSLVGPRPTIPEQVARYTDHQRRRLDARPGVTGLAQISGRQSLPWSQRIELDIRYIETWTPMADLRIVVRTALMLLRPGADVYRDQAPAFDLPERAPDGDSNITRDE
ncbi:MAG: sugar transferase [Actinobacteria bacterium]|nr:sugar transferase [Thermoleophilia bacterium]MCB9011623.1 sugar transferase [Actinomycetota bacterium]